MLPAGGWGKSQRVPWPPRNPDFTPLHFFLCGYTKGAVCLE
jgi:hypothetical protein